RGDPLLGRLEARPGVELDLAAVGHGDPELREPLAHELLGLGVGARAGARVDVLGQVVAVDPEGGLGVAQLLVGPGEPEEGTTARGLIPGAWAREPGARAEAAPSSRGAGEPQARPARASSRR